MIEQSLNGTWRLREYGSKEWLPSRVPGGVHLDLMASGRISDPFVCDEELEVQWVAERDWEYRRDFVLEADAAAAERFDLVFDGLDTLADVRLNGELLGSADNMFRTWRWDVTGLLRPGSNELAVAFRSAVRAGAELEAGRHLDSANDQLPGAPYLRKAPCHFGWDWGPKLPNIGLWKGVRLEGWGVGRLDDVRLSQSIEGGRARIAAEVEVERAPGGASELEAVMRVEHPDGRVEIARSVVPGKRSVTSLAVELADPELWWPNGLGGQPLYRIEVELVAGGRRLDARTFRVGLRTLTLRREPDKWGESFGFVVNGVPIFAKGSNWIPADTFPARITDAQLDALLGAAAAANHNMIRVWGGGHYETEAFYDACDRLGILVWQDFMFACSVYPLTDGAFLASVEAEVREQVRRLRHRACLALWCGNNEMEIGWTEWGWDRPEMADLKAAYLQFFGETLPEWVSAEDGATPYWPSSPSSGRPLVEPLGERTGDYHQWTVWHELAPSVSVNAPGVATTAACQVDAPVSTEDRRSLVLVAELVEAGSSRALVVTPFVPDKHLALRHPTIDVRVEPAGGDDAGGHAAGATAARAAAGAALRAVVRLRSDALARWVELSLDGADVVFSDNYFDLPARREIGASFALPPDWSIEHARKALRVRSVVDTYA